VVPAVGRAADEAERELFALAREVAQHGHAPYSGFRVGAVAVGASGRRYRGVNVENAALPAGLCAERAALAALVTAGESVLELVAVAAAGGEDCLPCGFCLQALAEFGDPLIVAQTAGAVRAVPLVALLPAPFRQLAGRDG
jgi:cytidine deaminase